MQCITYALALACSVSFMLPQFSRNSAMSYSSSFDVADAKQNKVSRSFNSFAAEALSTE